MKRIQAESENKILDSKGSGAGVENEGSRGIWYTVLLALAPLYLLKLVGALIFALVMLDRHFISLTDFVLQQVIFITILIIGIAIAIIAYSLAIMHAHRTIGSWRQNGLRRQATVGQLLLVMVVGMMLLPIMLALFIH